MANMVIEERIHLLWVSHAGEATPTNIRSIGKVVQ